MSTTFHRPLKGRGKPKRTEYRGVVYDSRAEADRAAVLDALVRAGQVAWWLRQVPVDIGEPGVDKPYRVDFLVAVRATWSVVHKSETIREIESIVIHAEDVKGFDTPSFRRHIAQWRKRGPFPLHVIRGKHLEIIERET